MDYSRHIKLGLILAGIVLLISALGLLIANEVDKSIKYADIAGRSAAHELYVEQYRECLEDDTLVHNLKVICLYQGDNTLSGDLNRRSFEALLTEVINIEENTLTSSIVALVWN